MTKTASFHDLDGASVFITGGGSGIGAALVEGFVAQGAKTAFIDLLDAQGFADDLGTKYDNKPLFIHGNITETTRLSDAISQACDAHGPLTVLVNNAALDDRHWTHEVDDAFYTKMMDINFKAYFFACQAAIPHMKTAGYGSIINFSSISYMMGKEDYPLYTAANAGITGMTRSMARENGADRIRVNAVMPGWVLTERQKKQWVTEEGLAAHLAGQCLKDPMAPEDMVGGVLFLASNTSKMMTGQALVIDAGYVVTG